MPDQYYDHLETRDPEAREQALFNLLPGFIDRAKRVAPGWAALLDRIEGTAIVDRAALAGLPVLRKSHLKEHQSRLPPFGGFATTDQGAIGRVFMSPGPIFEPEGYGDDWWRSARALHAAGFRRGDMIHNTFAYHLTPGGWILDAGARAIGCTVIPAGPGNTEQQIEALAHLKPVGFMGVPDFLKILLDKAAEAGKPARSITKAMVSGGALFPNLRQDYADRGIRVQQCYATADVGVIAYESRGPDGRVEGMILNEGVLLEIVRPGTSDTVPDGEVGEVVVTCFNRDYPMIRFATGDLSAVMPGYSMCGRTNTRIRGWLGRADQQTKVKGMFVHPEQIAEVAKRHPELGRLRLVVGRTGDQDSMVLKAESRGADAGLAAKVAETLQAITKLRGEVTLVELHSLPNDGRVIADERTYT